jgi:hypothetical protein
MVSEGAPTLLRAHLRELRGRYLEASRRSRAALKAGDLNAFESALRDKQVIHAEWMSMLSNYFENHVRLNWRAAGWRRTIRS